MVRYQVECCELLIPIHTINWPYSASLISLKVSGVDNDSDINAAD
jgi:hypothetical protein